MSFLKHVTPTVRLILIYSLIFRLLTSVTEVQAEELIVRARNEQTQSGSENEAVAQVGRRKEVHNANQSSVENLVDQQAETGGNLVSDVNGNVELETGKIQQEALVETNLNHNETTIEGGSAATVEATNQTTGSNSENYSQAEVTETRQVENTNHLTLTNTNTATLNTGVNSAKVINGNVEMQTGQIEFKTEIVNDPVNTNTVKILSHLGTLTVKAENQETQVDSLNLALAEVVLETLDRDENELTIENIVNLVLNTGLNECLSLNGDCQIKTGDIQGSVKEKNRGNDNDKTIGLAPGIPPKEEDQEPRPTVTPTSTPPPTLTPSPSPPKPEEEKPAAKIPPLGGVPEPFIPRPEVPPPEELPPPAPPPEEIAPPSPWEEILEKIIPIVEAALPEVEEEKQPEVLGITQLPITGLGETPYQISFLDLGPGVLALTVALFLRELTNPPKKKRRLRLW